MYIPSRDTANTWFTYDQNHGEPGKRAVLWAHKQKMKLYLLDHFGNYFYFCILTCLLFLVMQMQHHMVLYYKQVQIGKV